MSEATEFTEAFQDKIFEAVMGLKEECKFGTIEKGEEALVVAEVPRLHPNPAVNTRVVIDPCNEDTLRFILLKPIIPFKTPLAENSLLSLFFEEKVGEISDLEQPEAVSAYLTLCAALQRPRSVDDVMRQIVMQSYRKYTAAYINTAGITHVRWLIPSDYQNVPDDFREVVGGLLVHGQQLARADFLIRECFTANKSWEVMDYHYLLSQIDRLQDKVSELGTSRSDGEDEKSPPPEMTL
jgi:hypothetical protein